MTKEKKPTPAARRKQTSGSTFLGSLSSRKKDFLCVGILFVVTIVLFRDIVFKDMVFSAEGDTAAAKSWEQAGKYLEETEKADVLWMPYVFSGMPGFASMAYGSRSTSYAQQVIHAVGTLLFLNATAGWLVLHYFLAGVFMFLLARGLKLTPIPSMFAAMAFMLSPYGMGLAQAGHGSKLMAVSYIPLVFLLTHRLFQRPDLLSLGLLTAAIGTFLLTGHVQIVYYGFLLIGLYLLYTVALDAKQHTDATVKRTVLFLLALGAGFAISSFPYLSVQEYTQYSIRGGGITGSVGGLTYDYATSYSFHPLEMLTFFVPSFFGFSSPYYWGWKVFSDSSVYVGVLPILLGIIALVYKRNRETVFLAILTVLVLLASFGNHLPILFNLLYNYLPYFNKFRAPEMILHLIAFTTAILGAYGMGVIFEMRERLINFSASKLVRVFLISAGALVAILILGSLFKPGVYQTLAGAMFVKDGELAQYRQQYGEQQAQQIMVQLKQERFDLLWKDYIKFALIAAGGIGALVMFLNKKIQSTAFTGAIIGILLIDLWLIDGKFINPQPHAALDQKFQPDATVSILKQQPGLFRIFPLGQLFGDNSYMYHTIQSIGGYSPAKLKIYQTLIDSCLYAGADPTLPLNMNIVNMLNAKYLLAQGQLPKDRFQLVNVDQAKQLLTYANPQALPRTFFVGRALVAKSDHEVFQALNSPEFDAARTAVLQKPLPREISTPDSSFSDVTQYKSAEIKIKAYASVPALLVLSEVYYPAGWKAYVDGTETEIFKTNYVLRSVLVPAGSHDLVFKFEPELYSVGLHVSNASWGVTVLCILVGLWRVPAFRKRFERKAEQPRREEGS